MVHHHRYWLASCLTRLRPYSIRQVLTQVFLPPKVIPWVVLPSRDTPMNLTATSLCFQEAASVYSHFNSTTYFLPQLRNDFNARIVILPGLHFSLPTSDKLCYKTKVYHTAPNCLNDLFYLRGDYCQSGFTLQMFPMMILASQVWRYNCFKWKQV